ncbi:MAG TPA: HD domain-containing phosphohydrolase [Actinomycetota bacterium]|nr:HD domain-containing phosphohydrolase [Actinomycetota bacterium]
MASGDRAPGRLLIIDDSPSDALLLETILDEAGYGDIVSIHDPRQSVAVFRSYAPDLVLLDLHMPHMSGLDVMDALRPEIGSHYMPILVLTADISSEARVRALSMGAKDFLTKPFDPVEVNLRIKNLLETRRLYRELREHNEMLERKVSERTVELETAKIEILERLALTAELRDDETGVHTQRVGRMCALLSEALELSDRNIDVLRKASPLHDIGKIATPDSILLKPGKLSADEWKVMKRHTEVGSRLLSNSIATTLQVAQAIALTHHERWDGSGYAGLTGNDIPLCGRIVAVTDVFDALTHRRPYKEAWPVDRAIDEIASQRGKQFQPRVVDAFLEIHETYDLLDPQEMDNYAVVDLSSASQVVAEADLQREIAHS